MLCDFCGWNGKVKTALYVLLLRINNTYTFVFLNEEVEFFYFFSDHHEN